jgi:acyl-CoA-binding protein
MNNEGETESHFHHATTYMQHYDVPDAPSLTNEEMLYFYALYKQATMVHFMFCMVNCHFPQGPCTASAPSGNDSLSTKKWCAMFLEFKLCSCSVCRQSWCRLESMSQDVAQRRYVEMMTELAPNWTSWDHAPIDESEIKSRCGIRLAPLLSYSHQHVSSDTIEDFTFEDSILETELDANNSETVSASLVLPEWFSHIVFRHFLYCIFLGCRMQKSSNVTHAKPRLV